MSNSTEDKAKLSSSQTLTNNPESTSTSKGLQKLSWMSSKSQIPTPKAHSGKTRKRCPYCPFTSYYSASLTVHVRRHTGEKPYQCPHCNKVKLFRDRSNMNSHIRRFHKDTRIKKLSPLVSHIPCSINESVENLSEETPEAHILEPYISQIYSQAAGSVDNQPHHSLRSMPQTNVENQSFPIYQKSSRRKPTVVRKKVHIDLARRRSFEGRIFDDVESIQNSNDDENLHAFHHNSHTDDIKNRPSPQVQEPPPIVQLPEDFSASSPEIEKEPHQSSVSSNIPALSEFFCCEHCEIYFKNCILHTLHMGCHGYDDPFKCNTCGAKCKDAVEFHCHFARASHAGSL